VIVGGAPSSPEHDEWIVYDAGTVTIITDFEFDNHDCGYGTVTRFSIAVSESDSGPWIDVHGLFAFLFLRLGIRGSPKN
jgi:hypothetical protein